VRPSIGIRRSRSRKGRLQVHFGTQQCQIGRLWANFIPRIVYHNGDDTWDLCSGAVSTRSELRDEIGVSKFREGLAPVGIGSGKSDWLAARPASRCAED
jgi:hypothetical protein